VLEFSKLEELLEINFKDKELLRLAMTHASYDVTKGNSIYGDNERLEFLGDRVLGLVIASTLFEIFPDSQEGELALRYNELVRKETCTKVAEDLGLQEYILLGVSEKKSTARRQRAILGNLAEALIGAIYKDQGYEVVAKFIKKYWLVYLDEDAGPVQDAKTALQEWAQSKSMPLPEYNVTEQTGPDHSPRFTIEVVVDAHPIAKATAGSKRRAQQEAAKTFLLANKIWEETNI